MKEESKEIIIIDEGVDLDATVRGPCCLGGPVFAPP